MKLEQSRASLDIVRIGTRIDGRADHHDDQTALPRGLPLALRSRFKSLDPAFLGG
jgi:hypothetical protein